MADSKEQQAVLNEGNVFGQDDVRNLHVGLLLFNTDFCAIKDSLLPHKQVEEIAHFYCNSYAYTKASAHVHKLEQSGFQPGALVSGNMRNRVLNSIASATGRTLKYDKAVSAAFKAYDACSMPLVDLVETLTDAVGANAFGKAVYNEFSVVGVDLDQLSLSELYVDWNTLERKIRDCPAVFNLALWPALVNAGWKHGPLSAADGLASSAADAVATISKQLQPQHNKPPGGSEAVFGGDVLYQPPASLAADYLTNVGQPLLPCSSAEDVLDVLRETGQTVPASCILSLREHELQEAVSQFQHVPTGVDAPHRHVHDPSARRPGTPITSRKFMCANCSITTSTVWRTGNAGLTLCNACGMFYNKHDHEHRPEHLIASARAKAEAQQQAAASAGGAGASSSPMHKLGRHGMRCFTPDGNVEGDVGDDVRRAGSCNGGSESEDEEDGARRPRTRRRAQVNKWLASDDYLMLDGPLRTVSNQDPNWHLPNSAGNHSTYNSMFDDARCYDGQRHHTTSPCFGLTYRRSGPQRAQYNSRQVFGYSTGRSRSTDPEYQPSGFNQERWQQDTCGMQYRRERRAVAARANRGSSMEWDSDDEGRYAADEDDDQDCDELQQDGLEDRPLEDMETLLGRILLNSTSDASDSSAADALVAMSQSCLSQQEQHRLHAAVSCDIRAAFASPGPTSILRRTVAAATAAAAGIVYSPTQNRTGRQLEDEQQHSLQDEEGAVSDEADSGMDVDGDAEIVQQHNTAAVALGTELQLEQQHTQQAEGNADDWFAKAWSRVQATVGSSRSPTKHAMSVGADMGAAAWFDHQAAQPALLHCHSAPDLAAVDAETAIAAATGSYSSYAGGQYQQPGHELFQEECGMRSMPAAHHVGATDMANYSDTGSRSASPTKVARGNRRNNSNTDEDYQEKPSKAKGRSISRFGAEHKQAQLDHSAAFSPHASSTTPKKSPSRAVRRTSTGEPVRCANCGSDSTCLWRRDKEDPTRTLCNACGIYKTNNGFDRPTNGLFPFWKNGKERVVRRNVARPIFKPYKHQAATPDEFKSQQCHNNSESPHKKGPSSSSSGSRISTGRPTGEASSSRQQQQQEMHAVGDVHPGALAAESADLNMPGLTAALQQPAVATAFDGNSSPDAKGSLLEEAFMTPVATPAPNATAAAAVHVDRSKFDCSMCANGTASPESDPPSSSHANTQVKAVSEFCHIEQLTALGAAFAAAQAAAAAAAAHMSSCSGQLNHADSTATTASAASDLSLQGSWTAAVIDAVAAGAASCSNGSSVRSDSTAAAVAAPEMIGWVQQISQQGVVGTWLHAAYAHAVKFGEPVLLHTGHKVYPDGRLEKCTMNQVNNELGLRPDSGSQELAAALSQIAAAVASGVVPAASGAPPKVILPMAAAAAAAAAAAECAVGTAGTLGTGKLHQQQQ